MLSLCGFASFLRTDDSCGGSKNEDDEMDLGNGKGVRKGEVVVVRRER